MRVAHASDLHGRLDAVLAFEATVDVWALTGDFFPDLGNDPPAVHARHQREWFKGEAERLRARWKDADLVVVNGNHDDADLVRELYRHRIGRVHAVTPAGFRFGELHWAGFPHIPEMGGHWAHEAEPEEMADLVARVFEGGGPDVLVTHAPPRGLLDGGIGCGIPALARRLRQGEHRIRTHLFGHAHRDGGQERTYQGVRYINGACGVRLVELDAP